MQVASPGFYNIPELNSGFNDQASSIRIPPGWSVKLYEHINRGGGWVCRTGDDDTFQGDSFSNGVGLNDQVSSFEVFNSPDCGRNDPPAISFDTTNGNSAGRIESRERTWTFQGTASDPEGQLNRVEFRCSGDDCGSGPDQTTGTNWSLTRNNMAGRNDIYFVAYDDLGLSAESRHLDLHIDLAAPSTGHDLAGTPGENGWYVSPIEVQLHADDGCTGRACVGVQEVHYRLNGGTWQTVGGMDVRFTVSGDGHHTVEYHAVDRLGNAEGTHQIALRIDGTPPTGSIDAPADGAFVRDTFRIEGTAGDATSGLDRLEIYLDGAQVQATLNGDRYSSASLDSAGYADGSHTVRVVLYDRADNSRELTRQFTIDNTPPTGTIDTPHPGTTIYGTFQVGGVADDATSGVLRVEVYLDGTPIQAAYTGDRYSTGNIDSTQYPDGDHTIRAVIQDRAGNSLSLAQTYSFDNSFHGTVHLQSRSAHQGTRVFVTEAACPAGPYPVAIGVIPDRHATVTDAQGYFKISPYPSDRPYKFHCLRIVHDGFLTAQIDLLHPGDVGTIDLPGGDVTLDDAIDILDVTFVASRYGTNDPRADINADDNVDISDLVIIGRNLGSKGPLAGPQLP